MIKQGLRIVIVLLAASIVLLLVTRVVVTQPLWGVETQAGSVQADPERLRADVERLANEFFARNTGHPETLDAAADYIRGVFDSLGLAPQEQFYTAGGVRCRNVIARVGRDSGPLVVVGAHYDVCGDLPGADDNASGTAGLLELARLLSGRELAGSVELVAYSTEEPPFFGSDEMGSAVHAASLVADGRTPRAMICLEMIGYFSDRQPAPLPITRLLYPNRGNFILIAGRWQDRPLIRVVKRGFRERSVLPVCSYCGPTELGTDLSDHRNYWAQGTPAVMITDTAFIRNPNYHTADDTADSLDYERMARVVDGVAGAVEILTSQQ